jgi:hypothetical protein
VIHSGGKYVLPFSGYYPSKGSSDVSATSALETTCRDRSGSGVPGVHIEVRPALVLARTSLLGREPRHHEAGQAAPGAVGNSLGSHLPGMSFDTLSVWQDDESLRAPTNNAKLHRPPDTGFFQIVTSA